MKKYTKAQILEMIEIDEIENIDDILENFEVGPLYEFLLNLRESSITNMYGAAPYLYMGKERIESKHSDEDFLDFDYEEENTNEKQKKAYEKVLEMADDVKSLMIDGTRNMFRKKRIEFDLDNLNLYIPKYARSIVQIYMSLFQLN